MYLGQTKSGKCEIKEKRLKMAGLVRVNRKEMTHSNWDSCIIYKVFIKVWAEYKEILKGLESRLENLELLLFLDQTKEGRVVWVSQNKGPL